MGKAWGTERSPRPRGSAVSEARFWRAVLLLTAAAGALAFVAQVWNILIPFLLGLVIAYLVYPLVDRFVAMGLRKNRVVIILYALLLGAAVGLGSWLIPTLYREANVALLKVPAFAQAIDLAIERFNDASRDALSRLIGSHAGRFAIPFRADAFLEHVVVAFPARIIGMMHFGLWIFIVP